VRILLRSALALVLGLGVAPAARAEISDSADRYPSEEALRRYAAAKVLEDAGDTGGALAEYYRALALDPKAIAVIRRMSELAARLGDSRRSLEFADRGLSLAPNDARLLWLKGAALFGLGRAEESLVSLRAAVAADSDDADYTRTLARVAEQLGRVDVLAEAWRRTAELDEGDGEAWFQLAAAEARQGGFDAADKALANAKQLAPTRPGIVFMEGWIREGQGRRREAIDLFRRHLEIHAADQVTRRRLVQLLAREKRWDEAYREAERVSNAQPDDFVALEVETDLAFRAQRAADGERLVRKLRERAGADEDLVVRVLGLLARNGRAREGVALADDWSKHARAPHGDDVAAQALALAGDKNRAIARARRAVDAAPDSVAARVVLARLYQDQNRYASAESAWVAALARGADSLGTLLDIALCREQSGDVPAAERAVRDALRLDPDNPRTLNFLGYLLADHSRSLEEALELIRRALALDPDNGAYVDSLGWVYYRLGRLNEARAELERAVRLTGGDPVVHEHLGDVYKDLKMLDRARDQYRLSLSLDSTNAKVKAKLAGIR